MNHNFPEVSYNDKSTFKKIGNNYSIISNISKGNFVQPATTMIDYVDKYLFDFKKINF